MEGSRAGVLCGPAQHAFDLARQIDASGEELNVVSTSPTSIHLTFTTQREVSAVSLSLGADTAAGLVPPPSRTAHTMKKSSLRLPKLKTRDELLRTAPELARFLAAGDEGGGGAPQPGRTTSPLVKPRSPAGKGRVGSPQRQLRRFSDDETTEEDRVVRGHWWHARWLWVLLHVAAARQLPCTLLAACNVRVAADGRLRL